MSDDGLAPRRNKMKTSGECEGGEGAGEVARKNEGAGSSRMKTKI